jgi:RNA polymerase sigma factor (sigma-70 family)
MTQTAGLRRLFPGINGRARRSLPTQMFQRTFEDVVVPHLDAAFNYARWLARNEADAEDIVQDAAVRALRFFPTLRSDSARSWLLTIVRNAWHARIAGHGSRLVSAEYDMPDEDADDHPDPEALVIQREQVERVRRAVEQLPVEFREVIVLRELEGCSYKEIATIVGIPVGTVMSRLSRARERLIRLLNVTATTGDLP